MVLLLFGSSFGLSLLGLEVLGISIALLLELIDGGLTMLESVVDHRHGRERRCWGTSPLSDQGVVVLDLLVAVNLDLDLLEAIGKQEALPEVLEHLRLGQEHLLEASQCVVHLDEVLRLDDLGHGVRHHTASELEVREIGQHFLQLLEVHLELRDKSSVRRQRWSFPGGILLFDVIVEARQVFLLEIVDDV